MTDDNDTVIEAPTTTDRMITIRCLPNRMFEVNQTGIDIDSIPVILRKIANDLEKQLIK